MVYSGNENYFLRVHTEVLTKETKRTNERKLTRTFHPHNLHAQAIYVQSQRQNDFNEQVEA